MARQKCRDCKRCTESAMTGCLWSPIRIWFDLFRIMFIWPFVRKCPICKHPLSWHGRDSAGRFHD